MGEIRNSFSVQCRNANIAKERLKNTMLKELKKDMRKLLNKLFEWLGYVPKEKVNHKVLTQDDFLKDSSRTPIPFENIIDSSCTTNDSLNKINRFSHFIYKEEYSYEIRIYMLYDLMKPRMCIKTFYTDDYEYGKICAEELCEMLNQKI